VLLAITYLYEYRPEATVVICPADHLVVPEDRSIMYLRAICHLVRYQPERLFMLGVPVHRTVGGSGWVIPGRPRSARSHTPELPEALAVEGSSEEIEMASYKGAVAQGALWITDCWAFRARTLWDLSWTLEPESMTRFHALRLALHAEAFESAPSDRVRTSLSRVFSGIRPAGFSSSILRMVPEAVMVVPMDGVQWGGRVDREHAMRSIVGRRSQN
jgi:mannose-1-phosphate guanylyltransferase